MRRLFILIASVLLVSGIARAQQPKVEMDSIPADSLATLLSEIEQEMSKAEQKTPRKGFGPWLANYFRNGNKNND